MVIGGGACCARIVPCCVASLATWHGALLSWRSGLWWFHRLFRLLDVAWKISGVAMVWVVCGGLAAAIFIAVDLLVVLSLIHI